MKILHLGKYFSPFSGGLENYMRDAMVALARRGIRSVALVHQHALSFKTREETIAIHGHEFKVVRVATWARLLFTPLSPAFVWQLRRVIKTTKPDILHLHLPNPSVFWSLVLPSARRIPWVVHWHSDVITSEQDRLMKLAYRLYRPFEQAVLRRSTAIIATSPPYRDASQPLQNHLHKCKVVPLGIDTERFANINNDKAFSEATHAPTQSAGILQELRNSVDAPALKALAVGRLTYYKGFSYLLEAVAKAPGVYLDLIGDGDQASQLHELAASLELSDRVSFRNNLDDAQLAQLMTGCDCLCLPSIERTEAFGMVLLEAMYFGKATVVGDVEGSGMGWVVDDGLTGIKVKPANVDALARALVHLAGNSEQVMQMGQAGKRKFDKQFNINRSVAGLLDIYQEIQASR